MPPKGNPVPTGGHLPTPAAPGNQQIRPLFLWVWLVQIFHISGIIGYGLLNILNRYFYAPASPRIEQVSAGDFGKGVGASAGAGLGYGDSEWARGYLWFVWLPGVGREELFEDPFVLGL